MFKGWNGILYQSISTGTTKTQSTAACCHEYKLMAKMAIKSNKLIPESRKENVPLVTSALCLGASAKRDNIEIKAFLDSVIAEPRIAVKHCRYDDLSDPGNTMEQQTSGVIACNIQTIVARAIAVDKFHIKKHNPQKT
ncbi:hypothetical protein [Aliiglaciecola sp. M165]|uniref:hypothetical protein n=1 Tax=Aliiglaciecola sp. M165 TaxID=2593649 RepID=UPI0011806ED2|nr:hypothetical protein [Aliiglaciecola sp. M165]TRY33756.1 hypothetical protein FM019_00385 [Aliiglaciecola sp. M165]